MSGKTFRDIFEGKQHEFVKSVDTTHGLLLKLEAFKVITHAHRKAIKVKC